VPKKRKADHLSPSPPSGSFQQKPKVKKSKKSKKGSKKPVTSKLIEEGKRLNANHRKITGNLYKANHNIMSMPEH
jgi:hypothetical protein